MAKIAKKLTDLVGNTPLMELSGYCGKYGLEQNIIAKLEAFNPAGSVKDRVALSMMMMQMKMKMLNLMTRIKAG